MVPPSGGSPCEEEGPRSRLSWTREQRTALQSFAGSQSLPHGLVVRSQIVLLAAAGKHNGAVAQQVGMSRQTVGKWRQRFIERGLEGLYDEYRPGRPRRIDREDPEDDSRGSDPVELPDHGTGQWAVQIDGPASLECVWLAAPSAAPLQTLHGSLLHREGARCRGSVPESPDNAVVLCVDEKSQCQALERSQPMLPLDIGYVEGVTHDYVRHGTTTLFAALDVANGQVLTDCKPRHRHQEFLAFLRHIDSNVPEDLEVHLIVDNYSPHKHAKVKAWLARHPRYQMHFIPTYASWLNQVERWFGLITQRTIRHSSFRSV